MQKPKQTYSTDAPTRQGRTPGSTAETPAMPAAATNGNSGKQQLEAAKALAMAAMLAKFVRRSVILCGSGMFALSGGFAYRSPYPGDRRVPGAKAAIKISAAHHPNRLTRPGRGFDIAAVDPNGWRAEKTRQSRSIGIFDFDLDQFGCYTFLAEHCPHLADGREMVGA